jgi:hypothetical protein
LRCHPEVIKKSGRKARNNVIEDFLFWPPGFELGIPKNTEAIPLERTSSEEFITDISCKE